MLFQSFAVFKGFSQDHSSHNGKVSLNESDVFYCVRNVEGFIKLHTTKASKKCVQEKFKNRSACAQTLWRKSSAVQKQPKFLLKRSTSPYRCLSMDDGGINNH